MNLLNSLRQCCPSKRPFARQTRPLALERLEDRRMFALPACSFDPATGVLTIQGTDQSDSVSVSYDPSTHKGWVAVGQAGGPKAKPDPVWPFQGVLKEIDFFGGAGNDIFTNNTSVPCFADGGAGNDTLNGGAANDILFGGTGDDRLYGRGGSDSLYGNEGTDYLDGGDGNDTLVGGSDGCVDECRGGAGHDCFFEYYRTNGTLEQEKLDDFKASEDWLDLLQPPGWWNDGTFHKVPAGGGSGTSQPYWQ